MDSSSQVGSSTYKGEKELVKYLAKLLNVSPGNSRGAVVTYGSTAERVIMFDEYGTISAFENAVDQAPHVGGNRRMDRALETASTVLASGRPNVPKIAVLLTTGKQEPASNAKTFSRSSQLLRDLGIKTFVITIGQQPSQRELLPVVDKPQDILLLRGFDNIKPQVKIISEGIAQTGKYNVIQIV